METKVPEFSFPTEVNPSNIVEPIQQEVVVGSKRNTDELDAKEEQELQNKKKKSAIIEKASNEKPAENKETVDR